MLSDSLTKLLICGWNSFTVDDLLKFMTHRPQQALGVFPDDTLTVLDCSHLHFLPVSFFFVFSMVLCKLITYSVGPEVRWVGQSRTLRNLGPTKSPLLLWLDVKDHGPADIALFDEFWCLHLDLSTLHISTVVLLLLSAVKLSMNSSEMTSMAAMDTQAMTSPPPCLTNEVVRHGLWAVSISSFHHSGTGQSVHNTLIQNCNLVFLRFASCGEPAEVILV